MDREAIRWDRSELPPVYFLLPVEEVMIVMVIVIMVMMMMLAMSSRSIPTLHHKHSTCIHTNEGYECT